MLLKALADELASLGFVPKLRFEPGGFIYTKNSSVAGLQDYKYTVVVEQKGSLGTLRLSRCVLRGPVVNLKKLYVDADKVIGDWTTVRGVLNGLRPAYESAVFFSEHRLARYNRLLAQKRHN